MAAARIKLLPPEKLPAEGLTAVKFEAWRSTLVVFLKQNDDFRRFLPGGIYAQWTAADENPDRIAALDNDDAPQAGNNNENAAQRLEKRQTQLETMLTHIAGLVDPTEYKDVMIRSTSVDWIWRLIEADNDIEKKGRHFLKLDTLHFNKSGNEKPAAFYRRFRSFFSDNLRKTGEIEESRNNGNKLHSSQRYSERKCPKEYADW